MQGDVVPRQVTGAVPLRALQRNRSSPVLLLCLPSSAWPACAERGAGCPRERFFLSHASLIMVSAATVATKKAIEDTTDQVRPVKDLWGQALTGHIVGNQFAGASMRGRVERAEKVVAAI
jgi:hypothetical protein